MKTLELPAGELFFCYVQILHYLSSLVLHRINCPKRMTLVKNHCRKDPYSKSLVSDCYTSLTAPADSPIGINGIDTWATHLTKWNGTTYCWPSPNSGSIFQHKKMPINWSYAAIWPLTAYLDLSPMSPCFACGVATSLVLSCIFSDLGQRPLTFG